MRTRAIVCDQICKQCDKVRTWLITRLLAVRDIENLRAIIDGTEFLIEQPSRPASQRATYSQYKSTNTFKLLVSISPIIHFNFVSVLYTDSISYKEIVQSNGFLDLLEAGDLAMGDKGFNIQDLLAIHNVRLLAPPMTRKNNVCAITSTTKRIAAMKLYISSLVTACAGLENLHPNSIIY